MVHRQTNRQTTSFSNPLKNYSPRRNLFRRGQKCVYLEVRTAIIQEIGTQASHVEFGNFYEHVLDEKSRDERAEVEE